MTPTPISALLAELDALGLQLEADEDRLRFRPRDAVTADLAARMKAHKGDLLAAVRARKVVSQRIAGQLAQLVPYKTPDGRRGWVNPRYRRELENLGLL